MLGAFLFDPFAGNIIDVVNRISHVFPIKSWQNNSRNTEEPRGVWTFIYRAHWLKNVGKRRGKKLG
jgi:hypothetical protein